MKTPLLPNKKKCTGCMACSNSCPKQCVSFILGGTGHLYPKVDKSKCINCGRCEKVCPILSLSREKSIKSKPYAAWTKDDNLRLHSSSGGFFAQVATEFIENGGVVCGATMFGTRVKHIIVDSVLDIPRLQGSKYLQSDMTNVFNRLKDILKEGKRVLFSGTPCQVAAIYNFIPSHLWENLTTIDLICHGVPSPLAMDIFEKTCENGIDRIDSFRDKTWNPWNKGYGMTHVSHSGEKVRSKTKDNLFLSLFSYNKVLRPSCYHCQFQQGLQRHSDVTIGDFWGIKRFPEQHEIGISLVISHSKKAEELLKSPFLNKHVSNWQESLPGNYNYYFSHNIFYYDPLRYIFPFAVKNFKDDIIFKLYGNKIKSRLDWFYPYLLFEVLLEKMGKKRISKELKKILKS